MGLTLFILLALTEILLVAWTCREKRNKADWQKKRSISRTAQAIIVLIAILLPLGQKWRLMPILFLLLALLMITVLVMFFQRKSDGVPKKTGAAVASCIFSILLIGIFLTPAFLFAGYKGLPLTGEYKVASASAILKDENRTDPYETDGSPREIPVHFYYPDVAAENGENYPFIVFSHGAFGYYESNASTYMELASNGYVVCAIDHPHFAFFTSDSDGQIIIVDQEYLQTCMSLSDILPDENANEVLSIYRYWLGLRVPDMEFVVDTMEAAKVDDALSDAWVLTDSDASTLLSMIRRTDMDAIGLMGHSMGGATSVQTARERDDINAVVDIDGTMLGEYQGIQDGSFVYYDKPFETPLLEFVNWEQYDKGLPAYLSSGATYPNDELMKKAAMGYYVTIRDTAHMDFTDLPMLSPFLGKMLGKGERDTKEAMTIVNEQILAFYDCYLKNKGTFAPQEIY